MKTRGSSSGERLHFHGIPIRIDDGGNNNNLSVSHGRATAEKNAGKLVGRVAELETRRFSSFVRFAGRVTPNDNFGPVTIVTISVILKPPVSR